MTLRLDARTWLGQKNGLINLIRALAQDYPSLAVILDGYSVPEGPLGRTATRHVASEAAVAEEIVGELEPQVRVKNLIGARLLEAIVWSEQADFYIAHHGTLQHKIGWLANRPGVVHAGKNLDFRIARHPAFTAREGAVPPVYVFGTVARDDRRRGDARPDMFSYELDWRELLAAAAPGLRAAVAARRAVHFTDGELQPAASASKGSPT